MLLNTSFDDREAIIALRLAKLISDTKLGGMGNSSYKSGSPAAWMKVKICISVLQNFYSGWKQIHRIEATDCFSRIGPAILGAAGLKAM